MSKGAARLAGSVLPIVVIYASILILVPYGRLLSQSLYRLWPETITSELVLPAPASSLAPLPTGTALCGEQGLSWLPESGSAVAVDLPADCGRLGFHKMTQVLAVPLAGRSDLALVRLDGDAPVVTLQTTGSPVSDAFSVGRRVVAGTATGDLWLWDEGRATRSLELGTEAIGAVHPAGDTILVGSGAELVQVATDGRLRALHRIDLGGPIGALSRVKDRVFVATDTEVVAVRLRADGGEAPVIVDRVPLPSPATRVHTFLSTGSAVSLAAGGVHILREDGAGTIWWGVQGGARLQAVDCAGAWGQLRCVTGDGRLVDLDRYPSRDALILGVGLLGALSVLGLLIGSIVAGRGALLRRIGVSVGALAGLAWLLSGTYRNPIESLHVLEYGAIGVLSFRALAREAGAGWAAAACAIVAGFGFGLGDETFQAVFPSRTGSMEDVLLDTQAVGVGVVLAWAGLGLGEGRARLPAWPLPGAISVMLLAGALFLSFAQGFASTYSEGPLHWTSRLTPDDTRALDGDAAHAPDLERAVLMDYGDYLRAFEDEPFLYELRVRLFRRDKRLERGDLAVACGEQAVIDTLFAQTVAATSFAWSQEQRAACGDHAGETYASPVGEDRITWASPASLWAGAVGLALVGLIGSVLLARRRRSVSLVHRDG